MKFLKFTILILLFPLLLGSNTHKFYVSITKIEYVKEKESVQIISKLFIDDIEQTLQERYVHTISLGTDKETQKDVDFLKEYIFAKLKIKVNDQPVNLRYIGKENDIDIMKVYLEIEGVSELSLIEIENKILMDKFPEQQNIIHFKYNNLRKNMILDNNNPKGVLNFN